MSRRKLHAKPCLGLAPSFQDQSPCRKNENHDFVSSTGARTTEHQTPIEVQSNAKKKQSFSERLQGTTSPCDLETCRYPHTVLFKRSGWGFSNPRQLVPGSGEGHSTQIFCTARIIMEERDGLLIKGIGYLANAYGFNGVVDATYFI